MPGERIRRRIDQLLDQAEAAADAKNWVASAEFAREALAYDGTNEDAALILATARKMLEGEGPSPGPATGAPSAGGQPPQPPAARSTQHAAPLPAAFAAGRYAVRRLLGQGAKKRVYLAHDTSLDRDVAFAVVRSEGLDAPGRARVQREARYMARIGGHPNLVAIFDIGEDQGDLYLVQEYMDGGDLAGLIRSPPAEPRARSTEHPMLSPRRVLRIAIDIAHGLDHLHRAGIVHRDLKPANVFLTGDGSAKVGDFGLAMAADLTRITQHGTFIGTVTYMPPEQAVGGDVDPRSDLYSLGCVLYELTTGRTPFAGDDPTSVISQHLNTPPVAPSWHREDCPPGLERLILSLLEKDPHKRPRSAAALLADLERVDPDELPAPRSDGHALERLAHGVFVGREKELERLRKAFDEALAGRGRLAMLVGEPGIGKTRTAQELETYARMRGAHVLWGRSHENSGAPAFWPWLQAARAWSTTADLAALVPVFASASWELSRLLPELRQLPGFSEPPTVLDPSGAQFRLFDSYCALIRAITQEKPLVITLDDLHWTDKPTLQLLQHLARDLPRLRLLVLCTYRDTDLVRTHPLSEALAELGRDPGFERIVLRGLARAEVQAYIARAAGREPAPTVVDRIFEETEGNPFFLAEVVNLLVQEGALDARSVSDLRIPDGVREALGRRLDRLGEDTNALLQVAAVVGREFTFDVMRLLAEAEGAEFGLHGQAGDESLLRLLEEGLAGRVIEEMEQPGRYRFTHALMQETLLAELSTTRRVRLHGQVGEALERRWGDAANQHASELAHHFSESSTLTPANSEKARRHAGTAADEGFARFAWSEAARWYELAVQGDADPDPDTLAALASAKAMAAHLGAPGIADHVSRAIAAYRKRGDRPGLARAVARLPWLFLEREPEQELYLEALAGAESDPVRAAILYRLIRRTLSDGSLANPDLLRWEDELYAIAEKDGFPDCAPFRLTIEANRAAGRHDLGALTDLSVRACEAFTRLGRIDEAGLARLAPLFFAVLWGDLRHADDLVDKVEAFSRTYTYEVGMTFAAVHRQALALLRWRPEEFRASFERGPSVFVTVLCNRGRFLALVGKRDEAVQAVPTEPIDAIVLPEGMMDAAQRACLRYLLGDPDAAATDFHAWAGLWRTGIGSEWQRGQAFSGAAVCLVTMGDLDLVAEVYGEVRGWKNFCGPASGLGIDAGRGQLALRLGLLDEARLAFNEGLEWAEREECPIEAGRNLQGLAAIDEREGDIPAALAFLDRAASYYSPHGIKLFLDEVVAAKVRLQGLTGTNVLASIDTLTTSIAAERPNLAPATAPDGTVTILFSDIEGSTALNVELGDDRWMEVLADHNTTIRRCIAAHRGFEVKTEGDAFMVAFRSARDGLRCAQAIQRAFAEREQRAAGSEQPTPAPPPGEPPPPAAAGRPTEATRSTEHGARSTPIRVRTGLHTGEPVRQGDDFFGTHVVMAARIAAQAQGGQILVSSLLYELLAPSGEFSFEPRPPANLKGLTGEHLTYSARWP